MIYHAMASASRLDLEGGRMFISAITGSARVNGSRSAWLGAVVIGVFGSGQVQAQGARATDAVPAAPATAASTEPTDIVVTGTRFSGRIASESPTPIDSIPVAEVTQGGRTDLTSGLKTSVPSFNTPWPTGSSFADFATAASLRGLSAGQTLVLVNGKRRHTVGEINQANSLGRGDITYDIGAIPPGAVRRVEVLRDGAAAQYGSDAIAGVINLVLDDSIEGSASRTIGTNTHRHLAFVAAADVYSERLRRYFEPLALDNAARAVDACPDCPGRLNFTRYDEVPVFAPTMDKTAGLHASGWAILYLALLTGAVALLARCRLREWPL
jgi:hypothetical protein